MLSLTTPDGVEVDIDVELADLIDLSWQVGCRTTWSCQDHGEAVVEPWSTSHLGDYRHWYLGWSVVSFASGDDLCRFMDAVAGGGPRDDLYIRQVHEMAPGGWRCGVRLWDQAVTGDNASVPRSVASSFTFGQGRLFLPRVDVPEAADRLARWLSGYERSSTTLDWDRIGWT